MLPATDGTADQYLKTDGNGNLGWATDATYTATSWRSTESSPTAGLVPATAGSGDANKYLKGDGTWAGITVDVVPTGAIMWWTNTTIPNGWLECKGQALSRTDAQYSGLLSKLGSTFRDLRDTTNFPIGTYSENDYFTVPDLRGEFIRGLDNNRGVNPGRNLGTAEDQSVGQHTHVSGLVDDFDNQNVTDVTHFSGLPIDFNSTQADKYSGYPHNIALIVGRREVEGI